MIQLLINIDVPDLERGIAFYRDAVGLQLRRHLFDGSVAEMSGAAVPVYLIRKLAGSAAAAGIPSGRDYQRHWTPLHLDVVVESLDVALAIAIAAGARQEGSVHDHAWGRLALLADPFGHGFCLLEWLGMGYDEMAAKV